MCMDFLFLQGCLLDALPFTLWPMVLIPVFAQSLGSVRPGFFRGRKKLASTSASLCDHKPIFLGVRGQRG